jgi:hypothetical protein
VSIDVANSGDKTVIRAAAEKSLEYANLTI